MCFSIKITGKKNCAVPGVERLAVGDGHIVWIVVMSSWVESHVILVLFCIQKMREISFVEF
jgi:hypothetical protein